MNIRFVYQMNLFANYHVDILLLLIIMKNNQIFN